jgi:glycosyltransferase 2 family protein
VSGLSMPVRTEDRPVVEDVLLADEPDSSKPLSLGKRFFNVRTLVSFGLGFAILLFLATRVEIDIGGIAERVSQANPLILVMGLIAFYATFPVRSLRWMRLLRNVGLRGRPGVRIPSTWALSEMIFLSWFANCIVPAKLGDAYRAYLLKLNTGVSFSTTVGTILAERIIDVLVLFGLMVVAASLSFGRALPGEVVLLMQAGLVLVVLVIVGLLTLRRVRPLVQRLLPRRFHAQYRRFEHGTLGSFRALPYVLALSGAAWAGEVLRLYLVTLSLGLTQVAPSVLVFVALASALATTLPLTPAGLGFAEGTIVAIFLLAGRAGLAPGVDEHTAASIALLDRGISYWSLVVFGLITYSVSKRK